MFRHYLFALWMAMATCCAAIAPAPIFFSGLSDASAAVQLQGDLFAVASDEDNILQFYRLDQPGNSVGSFDLRPFLFHSRKGPECDLEAAARIGNRVYWIASHGRDAAGEPAPSRHRFFALEVQGDGTNVHLRPVGRAYTNLLVDLMQEPALARYRLAEAAARAPKAAGGLNIEALTDTPEGGLLIGFRNPIPEGRALIVPLINPAEVVAGHRPRFGAPILLDLGGLGLRGIGSTADGYFLIAGPADRGAECQLYRWAGGTATPQRNGDVRLEGINPEGICFHDDHGRSEFVILSDDGSLMVDGKEAKKLPRKQRQFRAFRILR